MQTKCKLKASVQHRLAFLSDENNSDADLFDFCIEEANGDQTLPRGTCIRYSGVIDLDAGENTMKAKEINPIWVLGFVGLLLTGCATDGGAPYKGFEDSSQSVGGFATVKPVAFDNGAGFLKHEHLELAIYSFVDKQNKATEIASPSFARFGRSVLLLPGTYRLNTICYSYPARAMPSMILAVQAGRTYEIMCKPVEPGRVALELVNAYETADASTPGPN